MSQFQPTKVIRWKYLLPRLTLLLLIVTALRFGLDPLLHWAIVTNGETAVGAKVELAKVETSLLNSRIVLHSLTVANPRSPLRNLFQADRLELQIDGSDLLRKRLVVRNGTLSGLQLDTPRSTSGALEKAPAEEDSPSVLDSWFDSTSQLSSTWIDELSDQLSQDFTDQLQTPPVIEQLQRQWPQQVAKLREQVEALSQQSQQLEQSIRKIEKNPLRGIQQLGQLQTQLTATQQEMQALQKQIEKLPQQIEADRQTVLAARNQDEKLIRQQLQWDGLDTESLTQTLLGKNTAERLSVALDWIQWARKRVPSDPSKSPSTNGRGTTVLFGASAQPQYLIEQLQLNGTAQLGGQPFQLTGTLTDATTQPHLLAEPMRIELRATGSSTLAIEMTLDRRNAVAKDHLLLTIPQFSMPRHTLGSEEKLAVRVSPGIASLEAEITLTGDQLTGEVHFDQRDVQLQAILGASTNEAIAEALSQSLTDVNHLEAKVVLSGTLQTPQLQIQSDLGPLLASRIKTSIGQLMKRQTAAILARTQTKVDLQLAELTSRRQQAQQELLAKLGKHQQLLSELASYFGNGKSLVPQIGNAFRLDSLRK